MQCIFRLFQMSDVDDGADGADRLWAIGGIAIHPPSVNGYPANSAVATHDTMHASPFSPVGRSGSGFDTGSHRGLVAFIKQS